MSQSDHEALVEAIAAAIVRRRATISPEQRALWGDAVSIDKDKLHRRAVEDVRIALAVIAERLSVVTPAMKAAWREGCDSKQDGTADWLAMLNASPLAEGQSAQCGGASTS